MPTLLPTVSGEIRQSKVVIGASGGGAWRTGQPLFDTTAANVFNNYDIRTQGLYCLFSHISANSSATDIRFMMMSFDTSAISDATGAQLKIFGNTNSQTGEPSSHSTNGIQGWHVRDNGMASTTEVSTADWGELYSLVDPYTPTLMTDNLTSWNVGTSTPNTFTLTSAARTIIEDEDLFQIAIGHKFWIDHWSSNPPFDHASSGGNSPNGDNDFSAIAGVYHGFGGSEAAYKPQLVIPDPPPTLGSVKLNGAKIQIVSGKFLIE